MDSRKWMDRRDLNGFAVPEIRQRSREPPGKHRLARTGRSVKQHMYTRHPETGLDVVFVPEEAKPQWLLDQEAAPQRSTPAKRHGTALSGTDEPATANQKGPNVAVPEVLCVRASGERGARRLGCREG